MAKGHASTIRFGYQILLLVLGLTLFVLVVKTWLGLLTRSLSLLADTLHILIDCFSTVLSLFSLTSLQQSGGKEVWGHRRRETIAILLLVALLSFLGINLFGIALYQLYSLVQAPSLVSSVQVDVPLILLLVVVLCIRLCLALFERHESRLLALTTLRTNANQALWDIWLSILVLLSLAAVVQGWLWVDAAMAIVLLAMLFPSFWQLLICQIPSLLHQEAIAPEALSQLALRVEGVADCWQIRSRGMVGRQVYIHLSIRLKPEYTDAASWVTEKIENLIHDRFGPAQIRINVKR